jgi:tRNA (cytidine/uridine-2'-O-)-methyltransferase
MFHIVLVHPEIPPNTGNVIRLAANTGCSLHLIEPLGFVMEDRLLRRAGLDYHEWARVTHHASWSAFYAQVHNPKRLFAFTTRAVQGLAAMQWLPGDWLVFGAETQGLPAAVQDAIPAQQKVRLPLISGQRSLNLSNAVAISVFDAWRQNGYLNGE